MIAFFDRPPLFGPKAGGIVKKGHEEGMKFLVSILEEHSLPLGLFPLADVIEVGFVKTTGYMWILQAKTVEHKFKLINRRTPKCVGYDPEITGYVEKRRIKNLIGVKDQETLFWSPVIDITVEDPPTGKIQFKSLGGINKILPVEPFAAGQQPAA